MHTYFFALFPDDVACDRIVAAADALQVARALGGRRVARPRLHMTAHFIGRFQQPASTVEAHAIEAAERVTCAPFEMVLDRAYSFPRGGGEAPGIFAPSTPPSALLSVAALLRDAMVGAANSPRKRAAFRPHVTWLYSRDRIVETAIAPIAWRVAGFALAHTIPGQQLYRIVRRWPLRVP